MTWDLNSNALFEYQKQNIKGVPIGGFLSALLMCIWALVQKITFMECLGPVFDEIERQWDLSLHLPISLSPAPTLTFPKVAWVPKDVGLFNREGMRGWFGQDYRLVGTLHIDGIAIALRSLVLWDSHPEGRLGHVIQSAPRRQYYFLRNYLLNIQPLRCITAETS